MESLRILRPGGRAVGIAGPPEPAFARRAGLNPALRLAIPGLSRKVRRQAEKQPLTSRRPDADHRGASS